MKRFTRDFGTTFGIQREVMRAKFRALKASAVGVARSLENHLFPHSIYMCFIQPLGNIKMMIV